MEIWAVFILPTNKGLYNVVEAWVQTKNGRHLCEGVLKEGFVSREDAQDYCESEGYIILNN
jgi:hypothetical protein